MRFLAALGLLAAGCLSPTDFSDMDEAEFQVYVSQTGAMLTTAANAAVAEGDLEFGDFVRMESLIAGYLDGSMTFVAGQLLADINAEGYWVLAIQLASIELEQLMAPHISTEGTVSPRGRAMLEELAGRMRVRIASWPAE